MRTYNGEENVDYICCKICNKRMRQIHPKHLKLHNITLNEYKIKYPNELCVCFEYSRLTALGNSKRIVSDFTKNKIKISNIGKHIGDKNPAKRLDVRLKISKAIKKSFENPKRRLQNRIATIKKLEKSGQWGGYNENACKFFDRLNKELNLNGFHKLNGGEKQICGYLVDYYEPKLNLIIEWDEPYHSYPKRKIKDKVREREIINEINPIFIRIEEKTKKIKVINRLNEALPLLESGLWRFKEI